MLRPPSHHPFRFTAGAARELAARWVSEEGTRTPGFAGAFLHGSINWLPDDAMIPETSDIDVMLVLTGPIPELKPGKFRYEKLLLEVSVVPHSDVASAAAVLGNSHLAGSFHLRSVLADPTGWLTSLQKEVAEHFADEAWVLRRCADVEAKMRRPFPSSGTPFPDQVNSWLFPTGLTTHLLLAAGLRNLTVRRRYLAVRELLATHEMPDVYAGLLEDLGVTDMTPVQAVSHLAALEDAFRDAAQVNRSPFFFAADISEAGYLVAIGGTRELIEGGNHREAIFWLAATAVRCQQILIQDAPDLLARHEQSFTELLVDLGIHSREDLVARRQKMLARLPERWDVARRILASRRDTSSK